MAFTSVSTTQSSRRSVISLNLFLGHHFKTRKLGDPKGCRYRNVRRVATPSHDDAADAGMIVARVDGVPTASEKDFGPSR
jgi:hypothetical protein